MPPEHPTDGPGWDLQELLADTSLSTWVGVGLLAIGGYLVLSWFVPGIDLIGSLILLAAGVVLLAQHLQRGAGAWALYAGAVLTGMGAARALGDILPGSPRGMTAMGIGLAFLAIAYLRHSQAGGYGWQGIVGVAALAWAASSSCWGCCRVRRASSICSCPPCCSSAAACSSCGPAIALRVTTDATLGGRPRRPAHSLSVMLARRSTRGHGSAGRRSSSRG